MRFIRDSFRPDLTTDGPAIALHRLRSGRWLIEADCSPPPAHQPTRLLAGLAGQDGIAISLTSSSLLAFNLVAVLAASLAAAGCALPQPYGELALHEVLLNAVVHGNLGVSSGPAAAWRDLAARENMITAALAQPALATRLVTLAVGWEAKRIVAAIADQGEGYNPEAAAADPAGKPSAAGRGMLIARAAARVDIRDGGRCTRLEFQRLLAAASA